MEVLPAANALRTSHNEGGAVGLEGPIDPNVAAAMEEMGHSTKASEPMGGYQPIRVDWECGILFRGTDPRIDGMPAAW